MNILIKNSIKCVFIYFLFFFILGSYTYSQLEQKLYPSYYIPTAYEIHEIKFEGNRIFDEYTLKSVILSEETNRSISHLILNYYYMQINIDSTVKKVLPNLFVSSLKKALSTMSNEIHYFDKEKANIDIQMLAQFYNMSGFHNAKARYEFYSDRREQKNILKFFIDEDTSYLIKKIIYTGIDSLPESLIIQFNEKKILKENDVYNEYKLLNDVRTLNKLLLNNGYYYANYDIPTVSKDTISFTDSITIPVKTGKRMKIGHIDFIDSLKGQNYIVPEMKDKQMDIFEGDWYCRSKIDRSISNMSSLGVFDIVTMDTSSIFHNHTDTSLAFVMFAQYRKQEEWGASLFLNQTADKFFNTGIDLSYFNRNIGGIGQVFNPYARVLLKNDVFNNWDQAQLELQLGINFAQPLLWIIDNARVSASSQGYYSIRSINNKLLLSTFSAILRFAVKLHEITYFNGANIDFSFIREQPLNYTESIEDIIDTNTTSKELIQKIEATLQYGFLDEYVKETGPWMTANIIGISFVGDTRDNPFAPNQGYYTSLSVDGKNPIFMFFDKIKGIADFYRFQLTNYWFWNVHGNSVVALKQKEGFIYWFNQDESYVPFDRQFFCGGANSVRGWSSRTLRFPEYKSISSNSDLNKWLSDFVGSSILIEGSLEYRYKFKLKNQGNDFLSQQISNIGITTFIDWGNSYDWFIAGGENKYNFIWYEYITKMAVAAGLGFRYDTPVGPFRVDIAWKVFDPLNEPIFTRNNSFTDFTFHIGLGHAF